MMHPYFYHWHNRVELKPDPSVLQARWDAAARFSDELSGNDACSLLRMALFGADTPEFAKRFSAELVALEPTFLPEGNDELLRVMATATLYSKMETESNEGDAVALGVFAAAFHADRIQPVCKELAQRSAEYLATEAEQIRPTPDVEGRYQALERATEAEGWADEEGATVLVGNAILELGATMGRIAEENQFLWWLLGRRSTLLNARREDLSLNEYALLSAAEAAERVALLPPPASVESLIDEVLSQCKKGISTPSPLVGFVESANVAILSSATTEIDVGKLCPVHGLVEIRRSGGKVDGALLKKLSIPAKLRVLPTEVANQYFRELMFLRALAQLD